MILYPVSFKGCRKKISGTVFDNCGGGGDRFLSAVKMKLFFYKYNLCEFKYIFCSFKNININVCTMYIYIHIQIFTIFRLRCMDSCVDELDEYGRREANK